MNKCKNESCSNEVVSTGNRVKEFCSDRCRMQDKRSKANSQPEQIQSEQAKPNSPPPAVIERVAGAIQEAINKSDSPPSAAIDGRTDAEAVVEAICKSNGEAIKRVLFATRTNPDQLNHSKPLSPHGLKKAGLKANRVPIPGDHDYSGVCEQVDGKWQVRA